MLSIATNAANSGVCGDGVTYSYDSSSKILSINKTDEGPGEMTDYDFADYHQGTSRAPWFNTDIRSVVIGDGVTRIGNYAFYLCNAANITLPSSMISIGYSAFYNCSKLATLNIPNGVRTIEGYAFSGCETLESIEIPESVTLLGSGAFSGCFKLQSATLPSKIESIEDNLFYGCRYLTSIVIPNKVTTIKADAFNGCSGLVSISIPNSVTSIGDEAFKGCTGLKRVNISDIGSWCKIDLENYGNPLYYAHHLFINDNEIHDLVIPDDIVSIKSRAFCGFSELQSISFGASVTSIEEDAFLACTSLKDVNIPQNVTSIGGEAFADCTGLLHVSLPTSLSTIIRSTFNGCSKLESISIPEGVQLIETKAFYGCSNLKIIRISSSVKTIQLSAFFGCNNISDVYCYGITPPNHGGYYKRDVSHMFMSSSFKAATLHVPESAIDAYKDETYAYPWCDFGSIVLLTDEDTGISATSIKSNINEQYFTIDGKRINNPQKGMNIVKMPNGQTKKIIVK